MIHSQHLIDHPNARALAQRISELPDVLTVRWFPPFKQKHIDIIGFDGLLFKVILKPDSSGNHLDFMQRVSRSAWENTSAHDAVLVTVVENLELTKAGLMPSGIE